VHDSITMSSTTSSSSATATAGGDRVASQGGIIDDSNPTTYDPKNPLTVFIIQVRLEMLQPRTVGYRCTRTVLT
jgi:hypothetical protein